MSAASLSKKNKRFIVIIGIIFLLATVATVLYYRRHDAQGTHPSLAALYPEGTVLFIEAEPSPRVSQHLLAAMSAYLPENAARQADITARHTPQEEAELNRALQEKINTTFTGRFAMGVWKSAGKPVTGGKQPSESSNNMLVVLPLKQPMDFEALATRFNAPPEQFSTHQTTNGIRYYTQAQRQGMSYALIGRGRKAHRYLLISEDTDAMTRYLALLNSKQSALNGKTLLDQPELQRYLPLLRPARQGMFVLNNQAYQSLDAARQKELSGPLARLGQSAPAGRISEAIPVTIGDMTMDNAGLVSVRWYWPMRLATIKTEALRGKLRDLLDKSTPREGKSLDVTPEEAAYAVSAHHLDRLYDFMRFYNPKARPMETLNDYGQILKLLGLDFRKDIVGLFDAEFSAIGMRADHLPALLFENNRRSQATFDKIKRILKEGAFFPVDHQEAQIAALKVDTFTLPQKKMSLSLARTPAHWLMANSAELEPVLKTAQGKNKALAKNAVFQPVLAALPHAFNARVLIRPDAWRQEAEDEAAPPAAHPVQSVGVTLSVGKTLSLKDHAEERLLEGCAVFQLR